MQSSLIPVVPFANERNVRLRDTADASDGIDNGIREFVGDQSGAIVIVHAVVSLADRFAILSRFEIPEPRFDEHLSAFDPHIAESDKLGADGRSRPGVGLDVCRDR
jgi:hypothetical protein